jgi:hypothetical protein
MVSKRVRREWSGVGELESEWEGEASSRNRRPNTAKFVLYE